MKRDEQALLVSAYLDDALEPDERARVEQLLDQEPDLAKDLHDFRLLGNALSDELTATAAAQDYGDMERAVLASVLSGSASERLPVSGGAEAHRPGFLVALAGLFRRPVVAFALGVLVAVGTWTVLQQVLPGAASDGGGASVARSGEPERRFRDGAEVEMRAAKAAVVLESLSVQRGSVEVVSEPDDPDAPVVLWYKAESAASGTPTPSDERPDAGREGEKL